MAAVHLRKVRSFVRRPGRITAAQQRALRELMPRFGILATPGARIDLGAAFGRAAPRILDVGFGDGEALLTTAANNPNVDCLGVEVHEPGIGHLLLLLERAGLDNVRIVARDAVEVVPQLPDRSFDAVSLFFPDPWPKKRHHKRRLVQTAFVAELARVLKDGGFIHVATDWADYAAHTRDVLAGCAELVPAEPEDMCHNPLALRPPTKFERRGRRLGHDVVDLYFRKHGRHG